MKSPDPLHALARPHACRWSASSNTTGLSCQDLVAFGLISLLSPLRQSMKAQISIGKRACVDQSDQLPACPQLLPIGLLWRFARDSSGTVSLRPRNVEAEVKRR